MDARRSYYAAWHEYRRAKRRCHGFACYPTRHDEKRLQRARDAVPFVCRQHLDNRLAGVTTFPTTAPRWLRRGAPLDCITCYAQERIDLVALLAIRRNGYMRSEKHCDSRHTERDINALLRRQP